MPEAIEKMTVRRITGTVSIIDLRGQLSSFAEHALREACTKASMPTAHNVILTVSGLGYMDSCGTGSSFQRAAACRDFLTRQRGTEAGRPIAPGYWRAAEKGG
jgi:anti-anti-sigma factor